MSVQDQIDRINGNISDAYDAVSAKGGTMPSVQNSANLATAVGSIPTVSPGVIPSGAIELNQGGTLANHGGYVDFHYNKYTGDYTSRIEENASGVINIAAPNGLKLNNTNIFSLIYPVGSIYMSVNSTNPGTLFGGTWERIKGRFLFAGNDTDAPKVGDTGGESTHKLTAAESGVPAHGHGNTFALSNNANTIHSASAISSLQSSTPTSSSSATYRYLRVANEGSSLTRNSVTLSGGVSNNTAAAAASAHNNMPPYLAVYVWKRTA